MAKDFRKGDCYRLYVNSGTYLAPSWTFVTQASELGIDPARGEVEIPERGKNTGYQHGMGEVAITFTLLEDLGSAVVQALIDALVDDTKWIHLAVASDDLDGSKVQYWHFEAVLFGQLTANQGEVASYDISARRNANSQYDLVKAITP